MSVLKEFSLRWILAVVFHLILLQCAFEFRKIPERRILDGLHGYTDRASGPAKRVVLTIVGGLRWESYVRELVKNKDYKDMMYSKGTYGSCYSIAEEHLSGLKVMMTGVPQVGLKTNVDSVLAHSRGLYVGSPSVDSLFFGDYEKYFYKKEWDNRTIYPYPRLLNDWVINKFGDLIERETHSETIDEYKLMIIYFPGIDICHHLYGPTSSCTVKELNYLMTSLNYLYHKFEKRFNDSSTAFILTSTNIYGSSQSYDIRNYSEVAVPFVTWGAGFCGLKEFSKEKNLTYRKKGQLEIQDIAPLISSLIGVPIPVNSFGVSPLYCLKDNELRAKVSLNNAKQSAFLFEQFEKILGFGWASYLSPLELSTVRKYISKAEDFTAANSYKKSIALSQHLIQLCFGGIDHYSKFKYRNAAVCVLFSLLAWILVTFGWVLKKVKISPLIQRELLPRPGSQTETGVPKAKQTFLKLLLTPKFIVDFVGAVLFLGALWALIYMSVPFAVLTSMLLTILMAWLVLKEMFTWRELYRSNANESYQGSSGKPIIHFLFFIIFTLIIDYPIVLCGAFIIGITFSCLTDLRRKQKPYPTVWTLSSLPVLVLLHYDSGSLHLQSLLLGGILWLTAYGVLLYSIKPVCFDWPLLLTGGLPMASVAFIILHGVPSNTAELVMSWSPAFLLLVIPLIGSSRLPVRLLQICSCLCFHVTLHSMNFELTALFFILVHVFSWAILEGFSDFDEFLSCDIKYASSDAGIVWSDIRCCIYYLSYVIIAFLAIGNSLDVQSWLNTWPSFQSPTSMEYELFRVLLKTFPVVFLLNIAVTIIGRHNLSGYLVTKQFLTSLLSFFQFLFKADYCTNVCLQFIFLLSYLAEPISIILLGPSLFSILNKAKSSTVNPANIEENKTNPDIPK